MSFSELKKKTGIESSGLMSFHLGKLTHLVTPNQEGAYALTDQGKEAVRMIRITRSGGSDERTIKVRTQNRRPYVVAIAVLLAVVIALGSVAVYQQNQLGPLSNAVQSHDPLIVYGTLAGGGSEWVSGITATSHSSQIVFTSSNGSSVTAVPNAEGEYSVILPGGQEYAVTVDWQATLSCSTACGSIINSTGLSISTAQTATPCPTGGCQGHATTWSITGVVSVQLPNSTNGSASGSCTGNVLDAYSTSGSYNYNISC